MKNLVKKIAVFALLLVGVQSFMFSEEKTLLDLNKEVLALKYELYQMENELGEYADMSSFKMFFEKAKKERRLRKAEADLKEKAAADTAKAKEAFEQAKKDLESKGKDLKKLGSDLGNAFKDFFGE